MDVMSFGNPKWTMPNQVSPERTRMKTMAIKKRVHFQEPSQDTESIISLEQLEFKRAKSYSKLNELLGIFGDDLKIDEETDMPTDREQHIKKPNIDILKLHEQKQSDKSLALSH